MEMEDRAFNLFAAKIRENVDMAGLGCIICLWDGDDLVVKRSIIVRGTRQHLVESLGVLTVETLKAFNSE